MKGKDVQISIDGKMLKPCWRGSLLVLPKPCCENCHITELAPVVKCASNGWDCGEKYDFAQWRPNYKTLWMERDSLREQIRKLNFMVENGLGPEDMKQDF